MKFNKSCDELSSEVITCQCFQLSILYYVVSVQEKTRGNEREKKNKQKTGVSFKYLQYSLLLLLNEMFGYAYTIKLDYKLRVRGKGAFFSRPLLEGGGLLEMGAYWGAGMAQWWKRSPPTNVARVWFRPGTIRGLSLLLVLVLAPRVFLRVLRFSSLHKNQHFQIPIRSGISGIKKSHLVEDPTVNSHLYLFILYFIL